MAFPNYQQATFLQLYLREAALRLCHTLPLATRQNLKVSATVFLDRFCNTQIQELHVLKVKSKKVESKPHRPENSRLRYKKRQ